MTRGWGRGERLDSDGGKGRNTSNAGFGVLGFIPLLQSPSKNSAMGTGRTWGTVKSGGSFCNIFLRFFFPSVNMDIVLFGGFWFGLFFSSPSSTLSSSLAFFPFCFALRC